MNAQLSTRRPVAPRATAALHATLWGLVFALILVAGWAAFDVSPLDIAANVVHTVQATWATLVDWFASVVHFVHHVVTVLASILPL